LARAGTGVLFVAGAFEKNLETPDVAIILPELVKAFAGAFHVGVVAADYEEAVRERFDVWPTPSLIFVENAARIGVIAKVRDWSDYLMEIREILGVSHPVLTQ
jgi:hydrogenase-1 operon protein HyaE